MDRIIDLPLDCFIEIENLVSISDFSSIDGNVSFYEMYTISSIIQCEKPLNLLEIGTFNGNTTFHMATHAPDNAIVHTLDLPEVCINTVHPLLAEDIKYINQTIRKEKKYKSTQAANKIREHLGDSGSYNFDLFVKEAPLDFAFIDGSHSYESVKSDTFNVLRILKKGGIVLWHDYSPSWPQVVQFLNELNRELPLTQIEGTSIVFFRNRFC